MIMEAEPANQTRRVRLPWALVPVALLLSSAVGVGSMAIVAARDPHFATEPDYYQKAIGWDQTQAQAATNQRLGYLIDGPAVISFDRQGQAMLELTVHDRLGQPVTGAALAAQAFANAYSARPVRLVFEERAAGHYRAKLTIDHAGQWVFELVGRANGQRFTADFRADLRAGDSA